MATAFSNCNNLDAKLKSDDADSTTSNNSKDDFHNFDVKPKSDNTTSCDFKDVFSTESKKLFEKNLLNHLTFAMKTLQNEMEKDLLNCFTMETLENQIEDKIDNTEVGKSTTGPAVTFNLSTHGNRWRYNDESEEEYGFNEEGEEEEEYGFKKVYYYNNENFYTQNRE